MLRLSSARAAQSDPPQPERLTLIWSILGLAMLVLIGAIAAWTLREIEVSDQSVNHTWQVISASDALLTDLQDAEIAQQQFVLDREQSSLESYRRAVSAIPARLNRLRELTLDNPGQQQRLGAMKRLIAEQIGQLEDSVRRQSLPPPSGAQPTDPALDRIRTLDQAMENQEYQLIQQRTAQRRDRIRRGLAATIGSTGIALIAFIVAPIQVRRSSILRDIAQRQREENASIAQSLFQSAPLAIMIANADGTLVMANAEASRMFGAPSGNLRGRPLDSLLPETFPASPLTPRPDADRGPAPLEGQGRRQDGSQFHAEISLGSIQAAGSSLAVVFVSDISRRRAIEKAMEEQRERLSHLAGRLMTVQEEERRSIARNLHDDLSQTLAAIAIDLGRLAGQKRLEDCERDLRPVQRRAAEAADYVRRISHQLHPSILDDLGLETALAEFCREFQQRNGIVTHFTSRDLPAQVPPPVANCIYRVAGESLRNIARHARSPRAFVELAAQGKSLVLTVRDEGIGFREEGNRSLTGIGVTAMKERAHLISGDLSIQSQPGRGTTVRLHVPLAPAADPRT